MRITAPINEKLYWFRQNPISFMEFKDVMEILSPVDVAQRNSLKALMVAR